jgi:hypothetical protein
MNNFFENVYIWEKNITFKILEFNENKELVQVTQLTGTGLSLPKVTT